MIVCAEVRELLDVELDGELDAEAAALVRTHLAGCPGCAVERAASERLRDGLRGLGRFPVPDGLAARIRAASAARALPARRVALDRRAWIERAAAAGVGAFAALAMVQVTGGGDTADDAVDTLVDAHVRALQAGHLLDLASADPHTVRPWLAGRLDFAPQVGDLAGEGFTLLGGRLDYVGGRPAAVVVYQRRAHVVDVVVRRRLEPVPTRAVDRRGFNLVRWAEGDLAYAAVSDLNAGELGRLPALLRARPVDAPPP